MKTYHLMFVGLCMVVTLAFAADMTRAPIRGYKFRETWVEGVPKEWGRLVNASSLSLEDAEMFFEALDGTIRCVSVKLFGSGIQWGVHVVTIPRP
jgi:hypothetical protein